MTRDDFTSATKTLLARRVGYRCSNPGCQRLTIGPAKGHVGVINLGEAAHITAASKDGPRFDSSLTQEQRKSYWNGISCCRLHGREIDSDKYYFTVEILRQWKKDAEEAAFNECSFDKRPLPSPLKIDLGSDLLKLLGFQQEPDLEDITKRIRDAAISDIQCFKNRTLKNHIVDLKLHLIGCNGSEFNVFQCAKGLEAVGEISIIAQPGMGKTTTLIQLTEAVLKSNSRVALFILLSEWSSQSDTIFETLTHRSAFRNIAEKDFLFLAAQGRLTLVLDGWNELNSSSRIRAIQQVEQLRREYPLLNLVLSTRKQSIERPISGKMIEIQCLSQSQQIEIAKSMLGLEGEKLVRSAWEIPGLLELISIPLYLKVFLSCSLNEKMPTTKEELLRLFVAEHEGVLVNAEIMRTHLFGFQKLILTKLAVDATKTESTTIFESSAYRAISFIGDTLKSDGQISDRYNPTLTVDILVNHHLLVRLPQNGIAFQHEQFQEWYASYEVENLMIEASKGCFEAQKNLRVNILNMPNWEEAILFCCERLSRIDSIGIKSVSDAILNALSVDSMLAAKMIFKSSSNVWDVIRLTVLAFINKWHVKGRADLALKFMIMTGKNDFEKNVWYFIENSDNQIFSLGFHSIDQFHLNILGDGLKEKISNLSEEIRERILNVLIFKSGIAGIELAEELGKEEPSSIIKLAIIEALSFRGAYGNVEEVLKTANQTTWSLFAAKGYSDGIIDSEIVERLRVEEILLGNKNPLRRLKFLSNLSADDPEVQDILEVVTSNEFPIKEKNTLAVLAKVSKFHPEIIAAGLVERLINGLSIPFNCEEFLINAPLHDEGVIFNLVTNLDNSAEMADAAVHIAGKKPISDLINQLMQVDRTSKFQNELYYRGRDRISLARLNIFIEAWLSQSKTKNPEKIAILANLVACYGYKNKLEILQLSKPLETRMMKAFRRHGNTLLTSPKAKRCHFAELSSAIKRIPKKGLTDILSRLTFEDSIRWDRAREKYEKKENNFEKTDAYVNYCGEHFRALAAIGDDESIKILYQFLSDRHSGYEAAIALREVWNIRNQNFASIRKSGKINYSEVKSQRLKKNIQSSSIGEGIFDVIEKLVVSLETEFERRHVLKVASVAFSMPYVNKEALIAKLLTLELPLEDKCDFFTALVQAGEIISAELIVKGIITFFEDAKKASWMLQENNMWYIKQYLELLPFSDRPNAVLDVLALFPVKLLPWEIRGVLNSLGHSPALEAENILLELAKKDPRLFYEDDWSTAMLLRNTESAFLSILEFKIKTMKILNKEMDSEYGLLQKLTDFVDSHPELKIQLLCQYKDFKFSSNHSFIEKILVQVADENIVVELVMNYLVKGRSFDGVLATAIKNVVLGRRPINQLSNAFQFYGLQVSNLRKRLFSLIGKNESNLAEESLQYIDEIRDEYGLVTSEARHPDIETNLPWPLEAGIIGVSYKEEDQSVMYFDIK